MIQGPGQTYTLQPQSDTELKWINSKHSGGKLSRVANLVVDIPTTENFDTKTEAFAFLAVQSLVTYAGTWSLQHCCLRGPLDLIAAAAMLPSTLQTLRLEPTGWSCPLHLKLSVFERFERLK